VQGRWLVPDPAGLAAVDITNPQTWNRYAYVANNPLSNVDPLGTDFRLCTPEDPGDPSASCLNWYFVLPIFPPIIIYPPPPRPPPPPKTTPQPPQQPINFPNETNGLPNGFPTNPWGVLGAIIPSGNCADMGPCNPIGSGFQAAAAGAIGGTIICELAEPCGGIEDLLILGGMVIYFAKGGKQGNVSDTGILADARSRYPNLPLCGLGGSLQKLLQEAKAQGDTARVQKINATIKGECRGWKQ
jgi:hypothetical protein